MNVTIFHFPNLNNQILITLSRYPLLNHQLLPHIIPQIPHLRAFCRCKCIGNRHIDALQLRSVVHGFGHCADGMRCLFYWIFNGVLLTIQWLFNSCSIYDYAVTVIYEIDMDIRKQSLLSTRIIATLIDEEPFANHTDHSNYKFNNIDCLWKNSDLTGLNGQTQID
jgi:hypothetical protein